MRLHGQSATIENGFVWLPDEAPWLADYLAEFAAFPRGRHDDQVELHRPGAGLDQAPSIGGGGVDRVLWAGRPHALPPPPCGGGPGWGVAPNLNRFLPMRGLNSASVMRIDSNTPSRLRNTSSLVKRRTSNPEARRAAERAASRAISSVVECVAPSTSTIIRASKQAKSAMKAPSTTWRRNRKPATCSRWRPCQRRRSAPVALRRSMRATGVNLLGIARPPTLSRPRKGGGDAHAFWLLSRVTATF